MKRVITLVLVGIAAALLILAVLWTLEPQPAKCHHVQDLGTIDLCE